MIDDDVYLGGVWPTLLSSIWRRMILTMVKRDPCQTGILPTGSLPYRHIVSEASMGNQHRPLGHTGNMESTKQVSNLVVKAIKHAFYRFCSIVVKLGLGYRSLVMLVCHIEPVFEFLECPGRKGLG